MSKLIFLDIDGTLCEPGQRPSQVTVRALHQAQANGHKIFISTGRNVPSIQPFVLEIGFDGMIASAGGYIAVEGKVLQDKKMSRKMLEHGIKTLEKYDLSYALETSEGTYADLEKHAAAWKRNLAGSNSEMRRMMVQLMDGLGIRPIAEFHDQSVYKIVFIGKTEEGVQAAIEELGEDFNTVIQESLFPNLPKINGETMAKGVDKGLAVQTICEYYGVDLQDAIAFGDSANDLPMLNMAGTGVVMDNAPANVKKHADVICESCAEDGIARQLQRMGII